MQKFKECFIYFAIGYITVDIISHIIKILKG